MSSQSHNRAPRCKVLYVDDEKLSLKYFTEIVSEEFDVITAPGAEEGWTLVEKDPSSLAIVVSDQRLGGMQGTTFLSKLREKHPGIIRILATAFSDVTTVVSAVNDGAIFHYINKPWEPNALLPTLRHAAESWLLRNERERLLREKAGVMRELVVSDRLAGYGVLAEGINHHLRNLLVPVEVYLQLAGDSQHNDPAFLEEVRTGAQAQMRRITDMLGRLSSIQKISAPRQSETINVLELWREIIQHLAGPVEEKDALIELDVEMHLPDITCNRARLNHVLRLVLEDILERLDPGGEIIITLGHHAAQENQTEHIRMEITDSGSDVSPDRLASVFTPFFVRPENPQYVGINLATSYVTLCSLGGWATASNESGRGTVLALCVPVASSARASGSAPLDAWERVLGTATGQTDAKKSLA